MMFGRSKAKAPDATTANALDVTYVGSVLMTISQAVFATAEYGNKPEGTWRHLTSLLYGVMYRRGWFPEASNGDMRAVCDLVRNQTQNPYGDMQLDESWRFLGVVPLDPGKVATVKGYLLELAAWPQSEAIAASTDALAPTMGKPNRDLLSMAQVLPLVHAAFTLVTVVGDTATSPRAEREARIDLAVGLEAEFIGSWGRAEKDLVASGRKPGDPHADAYQPWW